MAFDGAQQRLKAAAVRRKERHDVKVKSPDLREQQFVYLQDHSKRGLSKIQDLWSPIIHIVVKSLGAGGSVYAVAPLDDQQSVKTVNRCMLKPVPGHLCPQSPASPMFENRSDEEEEESVYAIGVSENSHTQEGTSSSSMEPSLSVAAPCIDPPVN